MYRPYSFMAARPRYEALASVRYGDREIQPRSEGLTLETKVRIRGEYDSKKVGDAPAWEQDLKGTEERSGRAQDKELLMERLRQLGYT